MFTEMNAGLTHNEFMTFQQAYLITSAWTGPVDMLPVDQCVAKLHSPLQIGVVACYVFWVGGYGVFHEPVCISIMLFYLYKLRYLFAN